MDDLNKPNDRIFLLFVPTSQRIANNPTCRPTKYTFQPRKILQVHQPPITAHKFHPRAPNFSIPQLLIETTKEAIKVIGQDRSEIGIGGRRYPSWNHFDHRKELCRFRNVLEAERTSESADLALVIRKSVRMGKDDCNGTVPGGV